MTLPRPPTENVDDFSKFLNGLPQLISFSLEMFFLPFMVALGVVFYCLAAVYFYFDYNFTTHTN